MAKKSLKIDMIAGSQLRDTQGEMLSVEGADISELQAGRGRLNDNHGKGFFNAIGRITGAKKIFKSDDCENDRHRYYWEKVKAPYIYVEGELYDDEDHPNAKAAAAILRNIHKTDCPLQLKASVEGGVVARGISDQSLLARTKIHSVALTFTPANNNTLVEPTSLDKSVGDAEADMQLIKSVMYLAETNIPSFRHIARDASATKVQNNLVKLVDLMKELGIEGDISVPSKQVILQKALETKIQNNVAKIHEMVVELNNPEVFEKNVKNALAGAMMAAGVAATPVEAKAPETSTVTEATAPKQVPNHEAVYKEISQKYPLLGAIGAVESSGGKNLKHRTIASKDSIHSGHTAGGMFGMMPHTAASILRNDKSLAEKYPELAEASKDIKANHGKFTETFNQDPNIAADFAVALYNRRKGKTKNDHMLTYSWLNGLKGSWNKYRDGGMEAIETHPYVQSVMKEYSKTSNKDQENKDLNKAMTAGYGGAGSPTSLSGGGVLQSESTENSPKFKYVNCDNCGKEQIYAKFQVKCRECGKGMSLEKLYRAMHKK